MLEENNKMFNEINKLVNEVKYKFMFTGTLVGLLYQMRMNTIIVWNMEKRC